MVVTRTRVGGGGGVAAGLLRGCAFTVKQSAMLLPPAAMPGQTSQQDRCMGP